MKENIMATDFEPHEYVILVQSSKIGTNQSKVIHSILNLWILQDFLIMTIIIYLQRI